jgi:hypothetical protein
MKLPALWIAAAFAAGIALVMRWPHQPVMCATVAALAILVGGILIWRNFIFAAGICALSAWVALGSLAFGIEQTVVPANHVTRLIAANRVDLNEPLRWRGRLREDPLLMRWGRRYEIDMSKWNRAARFSRRVVACAPTSTTTPSNRLKLPKHFAQATGWKPWFARGHREIFSIRAPSTFTAIWHARKSI